MIRAHHLPLLVLLVAAPVQAADVVFDLGTFITGPIANKLVKITPESTPRTNSNIIVSSDPINYRTDTDGTFTVEDMVEGNYAVEIAGPYAKTPFRILVPDTNITLYARDLLVATNSVPTANAGYSQAAANSLFVLKAAPILLPGYSTNGWVLTATDTNGTAVWAESTGGGAGGTPTFDSTSDFTFDAQ